MKLIILCFFVASSFADLRNYVPPHFGGSTRSRFGDASDSRFRGSAQQNGFSGHRFSANQHREFSAQLPVEDKISGEEFQQGFDVTSSDFRSSGDISCSEGQVLTFAGLCVDADISKSIYLYSTPTLRAKPRSRPAFRPKPKLNYNIVFVRAPKDEEEAEPIIVPPPQQKTIVYVLSKDSGSGEQEIIELPGGPSLKPEVYYVNYKEGENPELSLGLNLRGALSKAISEEAKTIFSDDAALAQFDFGRDSRFEEHASFQAEHSGFERVQEFHGESPDLSSDEFDVHRQSVSQGYPQQPSTAYGLPSRK